MVAALDFGHEAVRQIIALQKELYAKINPKKPEVIPPAKDAAVTADVEEVDSSRLEDALNTKNTKRPTAMRAWMLPKPRSSLPIRMRMARNLNW